MLALSLMTVTEVGEWPACVISQNPESDVTLLCATIVVFYF